MGRRWRRGLRSANAVVRESKCAVEKERGALSTARRSKRENAHARVRMLRCSSLVACVLTTDIDNASMHGMRSVIFFGLIPLGSG